MKTSYLIMLLLLFSTTGYSFDEKELEKWEATVQADVQKLEKTQPEKAYWLYLEAGRELTLFHYKEKATKYYEKALEIIPKGQDKTEIYVQLVNLNRDDKEKVGAYLKELELWFKKNPKKMSASVKEWLKVVKGYSTGETPAAKTPPFLSRWATDHKTVELIQEGKYQDAFSLLSPEGLDNRDINSKIEYDVLSSLVVGKSNPRLFCEPALKKYPNSIAWTVRICRYLTDWKNGTKGTETISSIEEQLKQEDPKRIYYVEALRKL